MIILGLIIIVAILVLPRGLFGGLDSVIARLPHRRRGGAATPGPTEASSSAAPPPPA